MLAAGPLGEIAIYARQIGCQLRFDRALTAALCEGQSSARFRNLTTHFPGGFDPFVNYCLHIFECFGISFAIRGATWQFWNLRDHRAILAAPIENYLITRFSAHSSSP